MKKLFYGIAALAIGFAAASCQQEGLEPAVNGSVTYEITLPAAPQTKGENGYTSYDLHYEVYKTSDVETLTSAQFLFDETVTMNGNTTTVSLELLNDQNYTVLFWAHKAGTDYYAVADNNQSDLLELQMNLDGIKSNNDDRDAFCAVDLLAKNTQSQTKEVKLVRPFSQVNIGTVIATDKFDIIPQRSQVTIKGVPTAFNVATGSSVGALTDITFAEAAVPAGTTTIKTVEYTNVAMNYIYVPEATVGVEYTIFTNNGNVSNEIDYVTVKKNHRTYIIGNLLTSNATYNIEILPGFEDEQTDVYPNLEFSYSNDVYTTSSIKGIQSAIDCIEDGQTIRLTEDVNIDAADTDDINVLYYDGDKSFTIDLNGKTISGNTSNVVIRFQKSVHDDNTVTTRSGVVEPVENTITIQNGTVEALENCWSAISIGSSASTKTKVNLVDLTIKSKKANDMAVRARTGAEFTLTNCEVIATNGAGGICAGGGNVILNNVTVSQTGWYSNNWNSVALGISGGGKITVNSGNYTSDPAGDPHGNWVAYIMSSGGTLEINEGTFNGTVAETANASNACGLICADRAAVVNIKGGTFNSNGAILDMRNNVGTQPNPVANLSGGIFSADPRVSGLYSSNLISVAEGYFVKKNTEGKFIVNNQPVAKVGNVGYGTIDEAVAAWTNNTTLTLCENVTLSDVVTLKSTEHHILNLATYTMTAAIGKNAIEIVPEGNGAGTAAKSCLTINADATNPGSMNAGNKACVYYAKTNGINDRIMVTFNGGVFNGTISSSSNNGGQACPYFVFNGGVFNKSINLTKAMLKVTGGIFHNMFSCTGDSTAYRLISGGTFKSWTFMTADAANKFTVGTDKQVYNVGVYVNDEGYLVVGGPVITEFGDKFAAKATNATKWSSYLQYSSAATNGLYYTNAEMAIKKHGEANVVVK